MIRFPRVTYRFSLRKLIGLTAVIALTVGLYAERIRENRRAVDTLRSRGVLLGCTYFDPIGPDSLYTWDIGVIPNGYFTPSFERRFCTEYFDWAFFDSMVVDASDIELLRFVHIRDSITFVDSRMEEDAIARLSTTSNIRSLVFDSTPLSDRNCELLARMSSLRQLSIDREHVSSDGLALLRKLRPDLDLDVYDQSE